MSQFDEYFTNNDKPFAENINDALLVSNVFDFAVNIAMPTMFSNGQFIENYTSRKCGVSIVTLLLNDGLSINNNTITGTGKLVFKIYPNFNSFGNFRSISWIADGDIVCTIENVNGNTIAANIGNGEILNNVNLKTLQEYVVILDFTNATLSNINIVFENKDSSNRYGANVKVQSVDGLSERLGSIENVNANQDIEIMNKVDKVTGKGLSTNDYANADKNKVDNLKSVATSGNYNDLTNKPTIPTKTSDLTNDGDGTNVFVKNNDSRLSNARTPTSHIHGNLSNDGKIGSTSGKIVVTGTNGVLQAADTITKSKISDFPTAMTPTSHTHTKSQISDFPSTMTPTSHSHGSLSNTGTLNSDISTVNKVAVTDSNNNLKTISKVPFTNLNITKANITGLGIPSTNTTYSNATTTTAGLMSSTDKSKLDGISTGATKNTIDTALSSTSTNAVQNKVVNTALNGKASSTHSHGNINSDGSISDKLSGSPATDVLVRVPSANNKIYYTNSLDKSLMGLDWKTVISFVTYGVILRYNDLFCSLRLQGNFTINTANSYTDLLTDTIPSEYRPPFSLVQLNSGEVLIRLKVTDAGKIQYYSPQTFTNKVGVYAEFIWSR